MGYKDNLSKQAAEELDAALTEENARLTKRPFRCFHCKNDLGTPDNWFRYGVKLIKYGYTMLPTPLCRNCFNEFETWLNEFDKKDVTK